MASLRRRILTQLFSIANEHWLTVWIYPSYSPRNQEKAITGEINSAHRLVPTFFATSTLIAEATHTHRHRHKHTLTHTHGYTHAHTHAHTRTYRATCGRAGPEAARRRRGSATRGRRTAASACRWRTPASCSEAHDTDGPGGMNHIDTRIAFLFGQQRLLSSEKRDTLVTELKKTC